MADDLARAGLGNRARFDEDQRCCRHTQLLLQPPVEGAGIRKATSVLQFCDNDQRFATFQKAEDLLINTDMAVMPFNWWTSWVLMTYYMMATLVVAATLGGSLASLAAEKDQISLTFTSWFTAICRHHDT